MERLDKLLASSGRWSRSEVKKLVKEGRVLLDGVIAPACDWKVSPDACRIEVDGEQVSLRKNTYLMLHKPAGILSATEDRHAETVLDLLTPELRKIGVFPVGRLDKDTEGLLLLTDDGILAHKILAPKSHVDKVYYARVQGCVEAADCDRLAAGMVLGDGLHCLPAKLEILSAGELSECLITLQEGKFHQVKRMMAACGKPVIYLKRISMGPISLDESLKPGAFRLLTQEEENALRLSVKCLTE